MPFSRSLFLLFASAVCIFAEDPLPQLERLQSSPMLRHLQKNDLPNPRTPAEQTVAQMYLPDGFRAEVVVAEPDLHQPVAFTFDERGRIWVVEAYSYPQKRPTAEGEPKYSNGLDKIVIFEDTDGNGKFETRKEFATGLNLVSGIEVGFGGVWVGAAPELLFIPDKNHDDKPDGPPQVLLDGFGYQDTHECLNSFMWGPDGWLYGNQGVFNYARIGKPGTPDEVALPSPLRGQRDRVRGEPTSTDGAPAARRLELRAGVWRYHPTRHQFEVFAEGGSNQWGLDYDEHGEIFMTHCRSYWARGGITHVIQGGIFWNQANANYPPYIIADPPSDYPGFRNYLLASARHDHGAGGAGERGTDAIYGGHSHVGTMIYFGDNWPDEYRGHLFTHNLGGHQINQEINRPLGSGYETVHAEKDLSFCADPKYVAVDLQYGPDGAVYIIDWYDQQHCHNPNTERWDRSNGRLYRIQYAAAYKPKKVDLASLDDVELATYLTHKNQWYVRTAQRLLQERSHFGDVNAQILEQLRKDIASPTRAAISSLPHGNGEEGASSKATATKWQSLVLLARLDALNDVNLQTALNDRDEYTRAWAVQIAAERAATRSTLILLAQNDSSPIVRRYLASAAQRVPDETAWPILEALSRQTSDRDDRNIPFLMWHGVATLMTNNVDRAFTLASHTVFPQLANWIYWYAATIGGTALDRVIAHLSEAQPADQARLLAGLELALETRANVPQPQAWPKIAESLYQRDNQAIIRRTDLIAAAFGDKSRFPTLREQLKSSDAKAREHAFTVLTKAQDSESLPSFIALLDDKSFRAKTIPVLARFDSPDVANALITRVPNLTIDDRNAALNALTSRASYAKALLEAVASGRLKRDYLTAFHVRQLTQLGDAEIDATVTKTWGRINTTPGEKQKQIAALEKTFDEAPLWAYDGSAGRKHFQTLCASCHKIGDDGQRVGPELTGAGKHGIRYYLENIIDPNAVIGTDFQMTTVETKDGDVISGLLLNESPDALTIRTVASEEKVAKTKIARRQTSDKSLMPEGLLETIGDRERIELLKYLTTH